LSSGVLGAPHNPHAQAPLGRAISSGSITYPSQQNVNQRTAVVDLSPSGPESPVSGTLRLTEVKYGVKVIFPRST
jgi:hypothetical protein